ncbi:unnamed protein product [Pleuronectes platessa]|uniref:Uncharacterized protein n=1 Tax=Pleuronectes platessa TaxID=8262 RepID=A0A9N7TV59_PLEPL|nr:unnamed protein product [Pleuronectes platessa]
MAQSTMISLGIPAADADCLTIITTTSSLSSPPPSLPPLLSRPGYPSLPPAILLLSDCTLHLCFPFSSVLHPCARPIVPGNTTAASQSKKHKMSALQSDEN